MSSEIDVDVLLEDYPALEDEHSDLLRAITNGRVEVTGHVASTGQRRVRVGIVREEGLARADVQHALYRDTGIPQEHGVEAEGFVAYVDLDALVEGELADGWTWTAVEEVEKA